MERPITVLCISSYFKGEAFLRQAKREGCRVLLLTEEKIATEKWPRESIDEVFLMPDLSKTQDVIHAVSYLFRSQVIDLIIALDEYDVENVATLREHLRLRGMGQTHTRYFRDKLAMRMKASEKGILVPSFTSVFNYDAVRAYMSSVTPPWVLKPRTEAGAMGIKKINNSEELWRWFDQLGDQQSGFLLEQFVPGDVFHVDSIIWNNEILFASVQQYGQPPMTVAHGGGVFTSRILPEQSPDAVALQALNKQVIGALGLERGVTHAEYIKAHADGQLYFLEIAARVGGAHISDLIEQSAGINPWAEWARIEIAHVRGEPYRLPEYRRQYGGLLISLAKQEHPDTSAYTDPEIVWRMDKKNHVGFIVVAEQEARVQELLNQYAERILGDFNAYAPPKDKPSH
ncbi:MAG: ATP-grasp domain-containing protein [Anaerolineae bacterium]|nr:ATP-grasp domain-containing protein [Anaerolineae bacterium]